MFAIKRWMRRYEEIEKTPFQSLETKLTEIVQVKGCIENFIGTGGTGTMTIFETEIDGCDLHFRVGQSELFRECNFDLWINFPTGEYIGWDTNNLQQEGKYFITWDHHRKVVFKSPEVSDASLYEDDVRKAGEKILKRCIDDLLKALQDILNLYNESQMNKKASFEEKYLK